MKKGILIILMMLMVTCVGKADELIIQRSCYPRELQAKFLDRGIRLDLDGNDRHEDSWGFLRNEGNVYRIFTYKAVNEWELEIIREIVNE